MTFLTTVCAFIVVLISCYALSFSARSIPKLQKYEDRAKKAAEWSRTADRRLWDTRYTVGAGFVTTATSLLSGLAYAIFISRGGGILVRGWPCLMAFATYRVRVYMQSFWDSKAKIPLLNEYNEAISETTTVISVLDLLIGGWTAIAFFKIIGL